ncbi:MAG: hypothetical protein ABW068_10095, partial [Candidatus Thiodiazotropha sp.]
GAYGTSGFQYRLATTGDYQPSLRFPWLAAKEDPRFNDIPIIMHSSLSADANMALGKGMGADAYVPKFEPTELSAKLHEIIREKHSKK